MTVRIGLLGCGRIGRMHAEMIARRIPGLALTRVFDVRRAAAEETAAALGGVVDDTPEDLIGADDVDAIAICSSTDTHVDLLVAGAGGRQAHLLREAALAGPARARPGAVGRRGGEGAPPGRLQPALRPQPP